MNLVEQHHIKKNHPFYNECDRLCFKSKNLYNHSLYVVRQEFIKTSKEKELGLCEHSNYLNYYSVNKLMKYKDVYCSLPRKVSNQTLMLLDKNWKSFFSLIKLYKRGELEKKPNLPNYLNKTKGRFITTYEFGALSFKTKGVIKLSGTNIKVETRKQNIKQVRIVPKLDYYIIEIIYSVNEIDLKENNNRYCSIDLGLNNLATVGSNVIKPIIINGKPLKSVNQYYNKKLSKLKNKNKTTKRIKRLHKKRNNKIKDYLHKSSRLLVNHLVSNNINTLVIGYNQEWKQDIRIGKKNNQNFVNIPHYIFVNMINYKCKLVGINVIKQEE